MDDVMDSEEHDDSDDVRNKTLPGTSRIKHNFNHGSKYHKFSSKICYEDNPLDDDNVSEDNDDGGSDDDNDEEKYDESDDEIGYNEAAVTKNYCTPQDNQRSNKIIIGSKPNKTRELVVIPKKKIEAPKCFDNRKPNGITCSHCTSKFPDTNALTLHLYKVLGVEVKHEITESDSNDEEGTEKIATPKEAALNNTIVEEESNIKTETCETYDVTAKETESKIVAVRETAEGEAAVKENIAKEAEVREVVEQEFGIEDDTPNKTTVKEAVTEKANTAREVTAKKPEAKNKSEKVAVTEETAVQLAEAKEETTKESAAIEEVVKNKETRPIVTKDVPDKIGAVNNAVTIETLENEMTICETAVNIGQIIEAAFKEAEAIEAAVNEPASKTAAAKSVTAKEADTSEGAVQTVTSTELSNDKETSDVAFKCPKCASLFKLKCTFLKHLKSIHDFIPSDVSKFAISAPKHPFSFQCPYCKVVTSSFTAYNSHIRKTHHNNVNNCDQETVQNKCLIGNHIFKDYIKARIYRKRLHPEMYNQPILKKCMVRSTTEHTNVNIITKPIKKTIAYKCLICKQIFKSYSAIIIHKKKMHPQMHNKPILKRIVQKQFGPTATSNKVIRKQVTVKTKPLNRVIHEQVNVRSEESNNEEIASDNNAPADLIHNTEENSDNQTESNINIESENVNNEVNICSETEKVSIWFCLYCECYFHDRKHIEFRDCPKVRNEKQMCLHCGLYFTSNVLREHEKLHEEKKTTLHDFLFFENTYQLKMNPKPPILPKCTKCRTYFLSKVNVMLHNCGGDGNGDNGKICGKCYKKFCPEAFEIHTQFHLYGRFEEENENQPQNDEMLQEIDSSSKALNILYSCSDCGLTTDKYDHAVEHSQKHLNNVIDIELNHVKTCKACDMEFEPRAFIQHNKLHRSNISSDISKDYFKILKYNCRDLLTGNWLKLFRDLPKQFMDDIISKSMYRTTQNVRMKTKRSGSGSMFYQCAICDHYINENSVYRHTHNGNCFAAEDDSKNVTGIGKKSKIISFNDILDFNFNRLLKIDDTTGQIKKPDNVKSQSKTKRKTPSNDMTENQNKVIPTAPNSLPAMKVFKCKCGLHFTSLLTIEKHFVTCPSDTIQSSNCSKCNLLFPTDNNILVNHTLKHQRHDREVVVEDYEPKMREVKLYECKRCSLLFPLKADALKHNDCGTNVGENCHDCNLIFHTDSFKAHECTEYIENDIITVDSTQEDTTAKDTDGDTVTNDETSDTISNYLKHTIFKCAKCDIHYLSMESWFRHVELEHSKGHIVMCELCKLKYKAIDMISHTKLHHTDNDKNDYLYVKVVGSDTIKEFKVLKDQTANKVDDTETVSNDILKDPIASNTIDEIESVSNVLDDGESLEIISKHADNVLFKCNRCPQHFVTRSKWLQHVKYSSKHKTRIVACPECKYTFTRGNLDQHIWKHHDIFKNNVKRNEIRVIHYSDLTMSEANDQLTDSNDDLRETASKRIRHSDGTNGTDDEMDVVSSSTKTCV